ncbi:MAG: FixG Ig-like domain-containing protein, partial [Planctomycetota bacterium]
QPRGLIRYSSQQGLEGHPTRVLRPRLFVYAGAIALLSGLLAYLVVSRAAFDVTLLRGLGRPFVVRESGEIENLVRVKLVNRTETPQAYRITADTAGVRVEGGVEQALEPGATNTTAVQIVTDPSLFGPGGTLDAAIRVADGEGHTIGSAYRLFGPSQRGSANPTGAKETNR